MTFSERPTINTDDLAYGVVALAIKDFKDSYISMFKKHGGNEAMYDKDKSEAADMYRSCLKFFRSPGFAMWCSMDPEFIIHNSKTAALEEYKKKCAIRN